MSGYRSESHSLRARIRELEDALDDLDREERVGVYATTSFARAMYWLGRQVGRGARSALSRISEHSDPSEVERLRARSVRLERALAQRTARRAL